MTTPARAARFSRRDTLRLLGLAAGASLIAACGQPATPPKPAAESAKPAAESAKPAESKPAAPVAASQPTAAPASAPASAAAPPKPAPASGGKVVEVELGSLSAFAAPGHPAVKLVDAFNAKNAD